MRVTSFSRSLGFAALAALTAADASAQTPAAPGAEVYVLEDTYLDWPVAAADRAYAAIDGRHLHDYVKQITAISRRYRDAGHQFWGRIQGTSADKETAEWLAARFRAIPGVEVETQTFDLPAQWFPQRWEVTARAGGRTLGLATAQPGSRTVPTAGTLDLEIAYVGLGTAADFQGRDVRGKAVLIYSIPEPGVWSNTARQINAVGRAQEAGAAVAIVVIRLPGNVRTQFSMNAAAGTATGEPIPAFTMGQQDGDALRELIETAPAGQPARVSVRLDIEMVEGLETYNVWGTLPGMTDEKILIVAHRDGYFESAGDNASGMATMLGLAEYFASIPKEQRRRTIQFVGSAGHHGTQVGVQWMADNAATVLEKTALAINAEHTALTAQQQFAGRLRPTNTMNALHWSFNGSRKLIDVAIDAFASFGVPTYTGTDNVAMAEISRIRSLVPSFGVIDVDTYYHSDHETDAAIPWTGLASTTRAMAKLIDGVNRFEIVELQPSPETARTP